MEPEVVARKAQVTFDWADGTYTFRLLVGQLMELQDLCDAGPAWIKARLETDTWKVQDLIQPIRLGLIGGGMKPDEARKLVRRYVEERPLAESILPARAILSAVIVGVPDEPPKKDEGEGISSPSHLSPEESSVSEISMGSAPSSDGASTTLTEQASGNSIAPPPAILRPTEGKPIQP